MTKQRALCFASPVWPVREWVPKEEMRARIATLDHALMLVSGRLRQGELPIFGWLLRVISHAGDGYLWVALLCIALATRRIKAAEVGVLAAVLGIGASLFLKHTCRRARPLGGTNWGRVVGPDKYSFPSGHTTTAFALATITTTYWPGIAPALWACAGCIALSRALLGFHYLSDVIAGVALGLLAGLAAVLILS
jgi:undecaprenyl-diphosphatase